jgi:uncharacterized membrane protein
MTGGVRFLSAGPLPVLAIILIIGLVIILIPLLILGVISLAFTRLGLSWLEALALVLMMLVGSFINIPLYRIHREMVRAIPVDPEGNGILVLPHSAMPVWEIRISVNLGGCIIPVCIAAYLVFQTAVVSGSSLMIPVVLCAGIVSALSYIATREITGVGIRVPVLIPALTALLAGILFSGGTGLTAMVVALAGGIIGTLAGGNLAHLFHVRDLEVPDVSIGGYGTFGAVFLCCILPALIA